MTTDVAQDLRLLDSRGCLTLEAMCFVDELAPYLREVVERHVQGCAICAQQQLGLVRVSERMRGVRPRYLVPPEAKVLARQVALKSALLRRIPAVGDDAEQALPSVPRLAPSWYRSRTFWGALLVGLSASLLLAAAVLLAL